jgi:predicted O-methyltransferase YrrM
MNKEELEYTKNLSVETTRKMLGSDDPLFIRIHHNFHHIVLYWKDFVMKEQCKNYLEIGTHYGHSLCNMLQSKYESRYLAVDLFKRFGEGKIENMEKLANDNAEMFNEHGYEYKIIKGNSQVKDTVDKVKDYFPDGIDLLFIDGDHSYKGITNDFNNYFPLVNKGGYIIFDDYLPYQIGNYKRPAPQAINDIVKKYKDQINDIGLVDDIVDTYKIKHANWEDLGGKNIDYIVQKL